MNPESIVRNFSTTYRGNLSESDVHFPAISSEYLKAEILNISKTNFLIPADEWDLTGDDDRIEAIKLMRYRV